MSGPAKNLGPIGSAVLTFIGFKQTRQATYYIETKNLKIKWLVRRFLKMEVVGIYLPYSEKEKLLVSFILLF